jgi:hypothetical protein
LSVGSGRDRCIIGLAPHVSLTGISAATDKANDKRDQCAEWAENKCTGHRSLDRAIVRVRRKQIDKEIADNRSKQVANDGEEYGNDESLHRRVCRVERRVGPREYQDAKSEAGACCYILAGSMNSTFRNASRKRI